MNGYSALAAALTDLAEWAEDELAGGKPPTWVAQQEYERTRHIAFLATLTGTGKLTEAALAGLLQGDQGDGETLTLGRAGVQPSGGQGWRAVRSVRQWAARAWARAWLSS